LGANNFCNKLSGCLCTSLRSDGIALHLDGIALHSDGIALHSDEKGAAAPF
jgi:hypothetical protein